MGRKIFDLKNALLHSGLNWNLFLMVKWVQLLFKIYFCHVLVLLGSSWEQKQRPEHHQKSCSCLFPGLKAESFRKLMKEPVHMIYLGLFCHSSETVGIFSTIMYSIFNNYTNVYAIKRREICAINFKSASKQLQRKINFFILCMYSKWEIPV